MESPATEAPPSVANFPVEASVLLVPFPPLFPSVPDGVAAPVTPLEYLRAGGGSADAFGIHYMELVENVLVNSMSVPD